MSHTQYREYGDIMQDCWKIKLAIHLEGADLKDELASFRKELEEHPEHKGLGHC